MPRSSAWPRIAGDEAYRGGAAAGGGRSLPAARDVEYRNARARADRQFAGCRTRANCRRSEEHTSELQSLMRNSYDVFCLKKTQKDTTPCKILQTRVHYT